MNEDDIRRETGPSRPIPSSSGGAAGSTSDRMPDHPVSAYIVMLLKEEHVTPRERDLLERALAPLIELHPGLSAGAVESVRKEMGRPGNSRHSLHEKEEAFWGAALRAGRQPIPGFDLLRAVRTFRVTPETDPGKTVVFLRPEYRHPVPPYIPPSHRMAEVFFWVILRMFRWHVMRQGV
ncbi:MAG: hypothetical protein FJ109_04695 [Deltaproteobacteria bacterium]|nr:hypothetical protein [Deltaproteobacteria bacterium]